MYNREYGYDLWMRYRPISDNNLALRYQGLIGKLCTMSQNETVAIAVKELKIAYHGFFSADLSFTEDLSKASLVVGRVSDLPDEISGQIEWSEKGNLLSQAFAIKNLDYQGRKILVIAGQSSIALLYGVFHFLRLVQTHEPLDQLNVVSMPKTALRMLNHWDNLDLSIERGYAGASIFDWHRLPGYLHPRYEDYARAQASLGINVITINNVNANPISLTTKYIIKLKALADFFRAYGIKIFLSIRFSGPMEIGGLKTNDPLDAGVRDWWKKKAEEFYHYIPDFGGYLVKANSEGQPGPMDYNRSHSDGANMLAQSLEPFGGIVIWRAFVYDHKIDEDRAKQPYNEFKPLDGQFLPNVIVQVKNGPVDFQPREPFHPLFGAMPKTNLAMEFQITQEYLGLATHLVYLAPLFKEVLDADTYSQGPGSSVGKVIDGSLENKSLTCMAAVANVGTDLNWCGHHFAQANWYAFGRLAWDHQLDSREIALEWIKMTFGHNTTMVMTMAQLMMESREISVNYRTPLGLHHIMGRGHHYGPGPWVTGGRADWTSPYYHRADESGLGFDRSVTGSNGAAQYFKPWSDIFGNKQSCPESLLLWFHHVSWDHKMKSGRTLWEELCYKYDEGVKGVESMVKQWETLGPYVDESRFNEVRSLMAMQLREAIWFKDSCLLYFQKFAKRPWPEGMVEPQGKIEEFESHEDFFVPGIPNPFAAKLVE
ncbi:MAG: alpha-glucuronidase [Spirochaetales bacterium]|nr:alpha-glucuronidase [Spirochaetales bacterium]